MSCWVAPAVAAELWGMPLARVLEHMQSGQIRSKTEYGFALVDVAPNSPTFTRAGQPSAKAPPPQTYVPLQRADDDPDQPDFEPGELHWRMTREATSRLRRRPVLAAA